VQTGSYHAMKKKQDNNYVCYGYGPTIMGKNWAIIQSVYSFVIVGSIKT